MQISRIRLSDKTSRFSRVTPSAVSERFSELLGCPISRSPTASCIGLELRPLPSPGITRLPRYYEPLRHPSAPGLSLTGVRLIIPDHAVGLPVLRALSLCTCRRHYPGAADGRTCRSIIAHPCQPSPIPLSGRPAHRPFRDPMTCCGWRLIPHQSEESLPSILELTMNVGADKSEPLTAIHTDLGAIFVSLELSRSSWLIISLSPGGGEKMSKHSVRGGDFAVLMERFAQLQEKARLRTGQSFRIIVIQEAGLDGFWIHRALQNEGIESHVVDAASIATSRRRRRAKTDKIDGETLVRALLAYKRGEPRVCAMVKVPTPGEEDRRHLCRERKALTAERVRHVNRIKGFLFSQGVSGYQPLRRDRRQRLEELQTGDGRAFPQHLKALVNRELDRLELLLKQIKTVEAARDALLAVGQTAKPAPAAMLLDIRGIGPEFAAILWSEGLFRHFETRRQIAAYAGLAPTPWQSGAVDREQGVSKAGNPRLRTTLIQLAWLWLRNQPRSALSVWFHERVSRNGGRLRKTTIVALARKLLVALWKYVTAGVVIEGVTMKVA